MIVVKQQSHLSCTSTVDHSSDVGRRRALSGAGPAVQPVRRLQPLSTPASLTQPRLLLPRLCGYGMDTLKTFWRDCIKDLSYVDKSDSMGGWVSWKRLQVSDWLAKC